MTMRISPDAIERIKALKGFTHESYEDESGNWRIGYDSSGTYVGPNQTITNAEGSQLLLEEVGKAETIVNSFVKRPMTQHQYDEMVSIAYDEGPAKFSKSSTLKDFNETGSLVKQSVLTKAPQNVQTAISTASNRIGVDRGILAKIAKAESGLNPNAKAKTSSATGLFQFIDSTWSQMVKKYGKQYGIGIGDRKDPRANAIMGALFTKDNVDGLRRALGREPNARETYLAHFSGLGGAIKVLKTLQKNPKAHVSAAYSPAQIRANRGLLKGSLMSSFMRLTNKVR